MENKQMETTLEDATQTMEGGIDNLADTVDGVTNNLGKTVGDVTNTVGNLAGNLVGGGDSGQDDLDAPLDKQEVQGASSNAFKEAYDYYKKNAVGDPKTREQYLGVLRGELAEYEQKPDGTQEVSRGLLKNFTDENYKAALKAGENQVSAILNKLGSTNYPNFEAFREAREKAEADFRAQAQNSVAFAELLERLQRGLEELSTKIGLQFNLTEAEKEKEQVFMADRRKETELQKRAAELENSMGNTAQQQTNYETEKRLLAEQNEKQAREWKARIDLESKLRTEQITKDLNAGYEERAQQLQNELSASTNQTLAMMMQMQKDSQAAQARLSQTIMEQQRLQQQQQLEAQRLAQQQPQRGLLSSILAPVTNLVGGLLGGLL